MFLILNSIAGLAIGFIFALGSFLLNLGDPFEVFRVVFWVVFGGLSGMDILIFTLNFLGFFDLSSSLRSGRRTWKPSKIKYSKTLHERSVLSLISLIGGKTQAHQLDDDVLELFLKNNWVELDFKTRPTKIYLTESGRDEILKISQDNL